MDLHDIRPNSERMRTASRLVDVWNRWVAFVSRYIKNDQVGCLVAWNAKSVECQWMYRIIYESHHGTLFMPDRILYLMDPLRTLEKYKNCELNSKNRGPGQVGHGLAEVYCYVTGKTTLEGAHNADKDVVPLSPEPSSLTLQRMHLAT